MAMMTWFFFVFLFSNILYYHNFHEFQTWKMLQYQLRLLQYNLKKAWPQRLKPVGWNLVEICPLRPWKDVQSYGYELLLNALWNPPWPVRQMWNRVVNLRSGLTTIESMAEGYHWRPKKLDQPFFQIRLFVDKKSQQLPLCCFVFVSYPEVHKQIIGGVELH